jgi:hypothetical protein
MAQIRTLARSFAGGEISPEMFGRIDLSKFQTGLSLARNFEVLPHGPVRNRAGFAYVNGTKNSAQKSRLIPFSFNTQQTFALEFGQGYIRFHTQGATLEASPGVPYEVATPYLDSEVFDIHYVQSADVLTLVHQNHPPAELRRLGATNWQYTVISFQPTLSAPGGVSVIASGVGAIPYTYAVTALAPDSLDESVASLQVTTVNDLSLAGHNNTVTWTPNPGAIRYNVYKVKNGVLGYIGQTPNSSFVDDNIEADVSISPPNASNPFVGANNYPAAVSYFEQRRVFAGTVNKPQTVWATVSGTESNLNQSLPVQDDDAIVFTIAAREVNSIRHLVPLTNLIMLTASAEWRVQSTDSGALTPSTISARPQSYIGANMVQPQVVGNRIVYPRARGGRVNELAYSFDAQGYVTNDLSLLAQHLFDGFSIVDMALPKAPYQFAWFVSSNGDLIGLTYVPEQQVAGWHHHDTGIGDAFESVCTVGEGDEDAVYVITRRTINGTQRRFVERMHSRRFTTQADCFFVDCGATYTGTPTNVVNGLTWLEGMTVNILGDGAVYPQQVVTGGAITLPAPAMCSTITVGLPITAQIQTLPLAFESQAFGQGRQKNVNKVWMRVVESGAVFAGPRFDALKETKVRTAEPWNSPPALQTGQAELVLTPSWQADGSVCIEQTYPLPVTIAAMTMEVSIGG